MRHVRPIEERFWSKVDKSAGPEGCWPWKAGTLYGYGYFWLNFAGMVRAHRFAYTLTKGPIPAGLDVCHSCDNHPCCNPAHLWPGTALDNMQDAAAKGRMARDERSGARKHPEKRACGERNGNHKLTQVQVNEIRERCTQGGEKQKHLAQQFNVSTTTIRQIIHRQCWK